MNDNYYANLREVPVAAQGLEVRQRFIRKTYIHVAGAIIIFTGLESLLLNTAVGFKFAGAILSMGWLPMIGLFILGGWISSHFAHAAKTKSGQYLALAAYIVLEAIIFLPMLVFAMIKVPGAIENAATATILGSIGLIGLVHTSGKDFSFLGSILKWVGLCAIIFIICSLIGGFAPGIWFSVLMIAFAGAAILYDTSNILHHYPEDKYISAALQLFGSIALMFWYILRIFTSRD